MQIDLQPEILPIDSPERFDRALRRAVELLRAGQVVALPTETVYGLAANALDAAAVQRIFHIKGRPPNNPIIVHVAGLEMARRCVADWPEVAERLAAAFWPGPLTLVLPRASTIPSVVTAGGPTVGVRWPSHPFIQAVIRECGFPLAAPSANLSTGLSPTTADHVRKGLGDRISLIVDGGPSPVGIESTVVDLATRPFRVLRPGMIHLESLIAVTGQADAWAASPRVTSARPEWLPSPGLLPRHYAPRAPLAVWQWQDEAELSRRLAELRPDQRAACHVVAHTKVPTSLPPAHLSVLPRDPEAFARALYAALHRCDDAGATFIVVEAVPDAPAWEAIRDRLQRAAGLLQTR